MVTCFAYVTTSEAACASQRLHARSCGHAMCLLSLFFPVISHLCVQSCHNFYHSFVVCVAIAYACNASLPFRCHVCCQELLPAIQILPLNLPPVFLPRPRICQRFLPQLLPLPLPLSVFCRPCCSEDCHRYCHCPRGCHGCCHQI